MNGPAAKDVAARTTSKELEAAIAARRDHLSLQLAEACAKRDFEALMWIHAELMTLHALYGKNSPLPHQVQAQLLTLLKDSHLREIAPSERDVLAAALREASQITHTKTL